MQPKAPGWIYGSVACRCEETWAALWRRVAELQTRETVVLEPPEITESPGDSITGKHDAGRDKRDHARSLYAVETQIEQLELGFKFRVEFESKAESEYAGDQRWCAILCSTV